jgi:uncharacterized membrane protein
MREQKKSSEILTLTAILGLAALGCVLLYGLRVLVSRRVSYLFLVWNLAIALVPYLIAAVGSLALGKMRPRRLRALLAVPFAALWLVFYPNAPYILTDFIHVINRTYLKTDPSEWLGTNALLWYDLVMNAAFAFIGHFIGLVSMWLVQEFLKRTWSRTAARSLVLAAILLSGFGIYLGRFSRLNSWDVLLDPRRVLGEVGEAAHDPRALLFSAVFALFILLTYGALIIFKRITPPSD